MSKGKFHKTLSSGGRLVIGEGSAQVEIVVSKVEGKKATLTVVAEKCIPIHHKMEDAAHG